MPYFVADKTVATPAPNPTYLYDIIADTDAEVASATLIAAFPDAAPSSMAHSAGFGKIVELAPSGTWQEV